MEPLRCNLSGVTFGWTFISCETKQSRCEIPLLTHGHLEHLEKLSGVVMRLKGPILRSNYTGRLEANSQQSALPGLYRLPVAFSASQNCLVTLHEQSQCRSIAP